LDDLSTPSLILVEASPLISFLKIDRFDLLQVLETPLACTDFVQEEIQRPREKLEEILASGLLAEIPLDTPQHLLEVENLYDRGLGRGEASSIVLAQAEGYGLVMDNKRAQKVATARNIKVITTAEVIVLNIQRGNISLNEADGFIEQWKVLGEFPVSVQTFADLTPSSVSNARVCDRPSRLQLQTERSHFWWWAISGVRFEIALERWSKRK
jgi:predicted nucleic acid-binding protein